MVSKARSPKTASGPLKVTEPVVHQWGYQGVRSEIAPTLPPKPQNWPFAALGIPGAAAAVAGFEMVGGYGEALPATVAAGLAGAAGVTAIGLRNKERSAIADRATEDVAVHVSTYLTRKCLKVLKWEGGWIGYPARVRIRYAQGAADNPSLKNTLAELLEDRLGRPYRLISENSRGRSLVYEVTEHAPAPDSEETPSKVEQRVDKIVKKLFTPRGAGEQPTYELFWDNDVLEKVIIRHDISDVVENRVVQTLKTRKFSNSVPGEWKAEWDTEEDYVVFTHPPKLPDVIPHPPRNPDEPMKIAFGQFRTGEPCIWDLDAPLPHLLINGGTGGGKTVLILSILLGLPLGRTKIVPIDPKRIGLFNLDLIPGGRKAATTEKAIVDALFEVKAEMDRRYEFLESEGPHLRETLDPVVLVIDEGEEMNDMLSDWWVSGEGKEDWKLRFDLEKAPAGSTHPAMGTLGSILRLGREARIHVMVASQQAAAAWLSTSSRSQFAVRIALRNLETTTSQMLFGSTVATSGLENLPGRAWVSVGMGVVPEHAQIYWTPKLQSGLSENDRAILHGLGIVLPDDEEFVRPNPAKGFSQASLPSREGGHEQPDSPDQDDNTQDDDAAEVVTAVQKAERLEVLSGTDSAVQLRARPERSVLQLSRAGDEIPDNVTFLQVPPPVPAEQKPDSSGVQTYGSESQAAIEDIEPGSMILIDESAGTWAVVTEEGLPDDTDDEAWALLCTTEDGQETALIAGLGEIVTYRPAS